MDYLYDDKSIDGTKLMKDWFPEINADIFISHSHADENLANALAGWLHFNFGLNVFIDSNVWGYSAELLEKINDEYSDKRSEPEGGWLYTFSKCNIASQHVNIMLSTALQKMIDKTECIIFLNTDKSVKERVHGNNCINETYSPWIYSEILCTQTISKIVPSRLRKAGLKHDEKIYEAASMQKELKISYEIPLNHLIKINASALTMWKKAHNSQIQDHPLDTLYSLVKRST